MSIGQLNGNWEKLLKAMLLAGPMLIPWAGWMTIEVFNVKGDLREFRATGPRWTKASADLSRLQMKEEIMEEVRHIARRLDSIEARLERRGEKQ